MTNGVVNPAFAELSEFVHSLPQSFNDIGNIVQNYRNDIRIIEANGRKLVVKSFRGMYLPNRIAYSLFRKSKAQRSYEFSYRLKSKGVLVPPPIGYIDCYKYGLLNESYYVSEYYEHTSFDKVIALANDKTDKLIRDFAKFTYNLHQAGIYHPDYSSGNILCNEVNGQFTFALVDLNRIKFKKVSLESGLMNFATLGMPMSYLSMLGNEYAALRGKKIENVEQFIINLKKKDERSRQIRKWLKRNTMLKIQALLGKKTHAL